MIACYCVIVIANERLASNCFWPAPHYLIWGFALPIIFVLLLLFAFRFCFCFWLFAFGYCLCVLRSWALNYKCVLPDSWQPGRQQGQAMRRGRHDLSPIDSTLTRVSESLRLAQCQCQCQCQRQHSRAFFYL